MIENDNTEAVIIIGGGVGPMAGVALHARIIEETLTDGSDQAHLTVFHHSRSCIIPDRTKYILSCDDPSAGGRDAGPGENSGANPALAMADIFEDAARALPPGTRAIGGIPCNSFHAPVIFSAFLAELERRRTPVRMVNMLEETVGLLRERRGPKGATGPIGVLSTTGMRASGLYDRLLEAAGWRILYVAEKKQQELHRAIYDPEWGIKAVSPPSGRAAAEVTRLAETLVEQGACAVVPGCTELPLVMPGNWFLGVPLVDPVTALARALIREAAPEKLRPLPAA